MFWVFLLPVQHLILVTLFLVAADFFTGIIASFKEGHKITSQAGRRTIYKLLAYESIIIFGFILETYMIDFPITKAAGGLIGLIEGKSLFENLYRITEVDLLKIIIDKLHIRYDNSITKSSKKTKKKKVRK